MITFKHRGNFNKTEAFLTKARRLDLRNILEKYAQQGVMALANSTPIDSGVTSNSWSYEIVITSRGYKLSWTNASIDNGIPVVILIQYGHGTGNGGYVQGRDFINPAIHPIMDTIGNNLWEEVSKL